MAKRKGVEVVSKQKKGKVTHLAKQVSEFNVVGVVDLMNLPSKQLQAIRNKLRGSANIIMCKVNISRRAFSSSKNDVLKKLNDYLTGIPAIILSNEDSFQLFNRIKKNQSPAPAKVGHISPKDIELKAGPTSLTPGPAISTFSIANVPAGVEDGKIAIKKNTILIKEGETFTKPIVDVLNLLGIEPMTIGLNLVATAEGNELFEAKVLDFDSDELKENIATAHSEALRLAIGANIITPDTASFLITRAELDARALATDRMILNKETTTNVLSKVDGQAKAVQEVVNKK